MKIAISKASGAANYEGYARWLRAVDSDVQIVDMIGRNPEDAVIALSECDGLVLSGGPDVDPQRYNEPEKRNMCGLIDLDRDELEFALAREARELSIPMLGICRGAQVLNVAYGGTLYADLPTAKPSTIEHRHIDSADSSHVVHVESGSIIRRIAGVFDSSVNSAHHQAVEKLASIFTPSALAPSLIGRLRIDTRAQIWEQFGATDQGTLMFLDIRWSARKDISIRARLTRFSATNGDVAPRMLDATVVGALQIVVGNGVGTRSSLTIRWQIAEWFAASCSLHEDVRVVDKEKRIDLSGIIQINVQLRPNNRSGFIASSNESGTRLE